MTEIKVEITGLGHEGEGVGRVENIATFVAGALPGETVLVRVTEKKKNFQRALLAEVLNPSPERIDAPCKVFEDCGGCQLQHMEYKATLAWKERRVRDVLERIGRLSGVKVHPVLGMLEPWRYRNKVQLQARQVEGNLALGYFSHRTNRLVPFTDCLLLPGLFNEIKEFLVKFLNQHATKLKLDQVVLRYSAQTGEVMVGIVAGELPELNWGIVLEKFPQIKALLAVQPRSGNAKLLAGKNKIQDKIFGSDFELSFQSFSQVNPKQTEVLYTKALEYAALDKADSVVDVYCGIGTITLALARQAKAAVGVEIVEKAIEDAKENARNNGIENVQFYAGPAEKVLPELAAKGLKADVVVVDPPRAGCEKQALEAIIKMGPQRIVYVSCDPATLARDLGLLEGMGYRTVEVQPVDMFPWTAHTESVCLLERM